MTDRSLVFRFTGYSGRHVLWSILPKSWQARLLARANLGKGGWWHGADPTTTTLVLELPWGRFRVVDTAGHVVPWSGE